MHRKFLKDILVWGTKLTLPLESCCPIHWHKSRSVYQLLISFFLVKIYGFQIFPFTCAIRHCFLANFMILGQREVLCRFDFLAMANRHHKQLYLLIALIEKFVFFHSSKGLQTWEYDINFNLRRSREKVMAHGQTDSEARWSYKGSLFFFWGTEP